MICSYCGTQNHNPHSRLCSQCKQPLPLESTPVPLFRNPNSAVNSGQATFALFRSQSAPEPPTQISDVGFQPVSFGPAPEPISNPLPQLKRPPPAQPSISSEHTSPKIESSPRKEHKAPSSSGDGTHFQEEQITIDLALDNVRPVLLYTAVALFSLGFIFLMIDFYALFLLAQAS